VSTNSTIDASGERIVGGLTMTLDIDLAEMDWEIVFPSLEGVDIHVDTASPFDAQGTYAGTLFPDSVMSAPRTSGPDGRDEGYITIDLGT
jgi:hypothetical protein